MLRLRTLTAYMIMAYEEGEMGTPHLQFYFALTIKMSLNQLKKIVPRAHLETKRGSVRQAIDYCKKDGHFEESGAPPLEQHQVHHVYVLPPSIAAGIRQAFADYRIAVSIREAEERELNRRRLLEDRQRIRDREDEDRMARIVAMQGDYNFRMSLYGQVDDLFDDQ